MEKFLKKNIAKKSDNFNQWYTDVILQSGLADYAPVRGCMVIKPYGYAIWENIKKYLDESIKLRGVKNAYFPLFIPERFLEREKEHIRGFSPELAVVTIGGGKNLKERLVIRPTSETIMYEMFSRWIKSWRDLPLLINQWANVVRWEMRPRLFLRTTEFLWQEGHTCHRTHKDALKEVNWALKNYTKLYRNVLALAGISGRKSESEKFAGAVSTYSYELMMPSGLALQGCTSHDLGENFSRVFNISFLDKDGKRKFVWQTSWGFTTRAIGALVMVHGDDNGLILPPKVAPIQVIIIPIFREKGGRRKLIQASRGLQSQLGSFRVELDERKEYSVGWKFNNWELKGVPLRLEIGPRELLGEKVTLVRRDTGEKEVVPFHSLNLVVKERLESIQKNLFRRSQKLLKSNLREARNYQQFKELMKEKKGFVKAFWCGSKKCEAKIKEETGATIRVLTEEGAKKEGRCIYCGKKAKGEWIFAKAY